MAKEGTLKTFFLLDYPDYTTLQLSTLPAPQNGAHTDVAASFKYQSPSRAHFHPNCESCTVSCLANQNGTSRFRLAPEGKAVNILLLFPER